MAAQRFTKYLTIQQRIATAHERITARELEECSSLTVTAVDTQSVQDNIRQALAIWRNLDGIYHPVKVPALDIRKRTINMLLYNAQRGWYRDDGTDIDLSFLDE